MQDSRRDTGVKNRLLDSVREDEGGVIRENITETCILPRMTSTSSMHGAGQSKPVLWDDPDRWGGEGSGKGVQDGGTHVHPWLIQVGAW